MTLFDVPSDGEESTPAAPAGPLVRVRMLVAYDGGGFRGFARQKGSAVPTVGGAIVDAVEKVVGHPVDLTCAGRTDAGVHAWSQVVHVDVEALEDGQPRVDPVALGRSVTKLCAPAVVVRAAEVAPDGFDARFSATARRYRYTVLNRAVGDPFLARTAWHVDRPLDLVAMQHACDALVGEHDFSSFCRRPAPGPLSDGEPVSLVRRLRSADWLDLGDGIVRFDVEANAFCHQMVRSLVGTMVEVGVGKRTAGEMTSILRAKDRAAAGQPAPPHGLCLWEVVYDDGFGEQPVGSLVDKDRDPVGPGWRW